MLSDIRFILTNKEFRDNFSSLGEKDVLIGLLNIKPSEEYLFLDLVERGVRIFPSAISQLISRSKCLQASVYKDFMVPLTFVARDRHDMVQMINVYGKHNIGPVITKQNRFNCGLGIHKWESIEQVYNQACFGGLTYPFVVQPFVSGIKDVRVVILGDYIEAYWRHNPNTFRNNLFFGGNCGIYELSKDQLSLCEKVMKRGKFPYAHIDLMVKDDGTTYLSEINLRGGLKGARISTAEYELRIKAIHLYYQYSLEQEELMFSFLSHIMNRPDRDKYQLLPNFQFKDNP